MIELVQSWSAKRIIVDVSDDCHRCAVRFLHWRANLRAILLPDSWNGIDAFSNEFQLYWVSVLYIAVMAELICFLGLVVYLWTTRRHSTGSDF